MIRYRLATPTALAALMIVGVAHASPPSPLQSSTPSFIRLVGSSGGAADSLSGKFSVVVRGDFQNPIPNSMVTLDFAACPDLRIASDQLSPNITVDCVHRWVSAFTNASGVVNFTVVGGSWSAGTYSGAGGAHLYADGVLLGVPTVAAFDLDGTGGVTAADLSICLGDVGSHAYRERSDFSGDGHLSASDLSVLLGVMARRGSTSSGVPCP